MSDSPSIFDLTWRAVLMFACRDRRRDAVQGRVPRVSSPRVDKKALHGYWVDPSDGPVFGGLIECLRENGVNGRGSALQRMKKTAGVPQGKQRDPVWGFDVVSVQKEWEGLFAPLVLLIGLEDAPS